MKKGLLIALGIGAAVLLLSKNKQNPPCDARLVRLPTGEVVCETVLPAMGFILYRDGKYYHRTQFQPPAGGQFSGIPANSAQWQGILTGLITQGVDLFQQFQTTNSYQGEPWAGDGGGGAGSGGGGFYDPPGGSGGNDPYGGMAGITTSARGGRWVCRDGRYSNSQIKSGACSYHGGILYKL